MKRKKYLFITVIIAALLVVTPAWANLIQNGSFENGTDPNSGPNKYITLYSLNNTDITGWTVNGGTGSSIDYIGSYWVASEGNRSIDMAGLSNGSISQSFGTNIGATYLVKFFMAGNPDGEPTIKKLNVTAGGTSQDYTFNTAGYTRGSMGWTDKEFTFQATGITTTLTFSNAYSGSDPFYGVALDDVRVGVVPIPPTVLLLGAGLIGLVGVRRRFKK